MCGRSRPVCKLGSAGYGESLLVLFRPVQAGIRRRNAGRVPAGCRHWLTIWLQLHECEIPATLNEPAVAAITKTVTWTLAVPPVEATRRLRTALEAMGATVQPAGPGDTIEADTPRAFLRNRWEAHLSIRLSEPAEGKSDATIAVTPRAGTAHKSILDELVRQEELASIVIDRTQLNSTWRAIRKDQEAVRSGRMAAAHAKAEERHARFDERRAKLDERRAKLEAKIAKSEAKAAGVEIEDADAVAARARTAYSRGNELFQYVAAVEVVRGDVHFGLGVQTKRQTIDQSAQLNAIAKEGWDLVSTSSAFRQDEQKSRDRFLASGQNVAVRGALINTYTFKRKT